MGNKEYSKKTWIITAIMAVIAIIMEIAVMVMPRYTILRESSPFTLAIAVVILLVSLKKIIEKSKQEKEGKDQ